MLEDIRQKILNAYYETYNALEGKSPSELESWHHRSDELRRRPVDFSLRTAAEILHTACSIRLEEFNENLTNSKLQRTDNSPQQSE